MAKQYGEKRSLGHMGPILGKYVEVGEIIRG
jgi:hypothetical protein